MVCPHIVNMMGCEKIYYERRYDVEQVDISDLTWEQKEKVLRYLFARMNRTVSAPAVGAVKKAAVKPAEEQQPSLMDREAWLAVLRVILIFSNTCIVKTAIGHCSCYQSVNHICIVPKIVNHNNSSVLVAFCVFRDQI